MGPNTTTFLIPVEVFPTRVRGTAHGIAAASGKAGAVVTAFAFGSLTDSIGLRGVLGLLSGVMALTALVTLMIPETKGRSLEEIEHGIIYGVRKDRDNNASYGDVTPVTTSSNQTEEAHVYPKGTEHRKDVVTV